MLRKGLETVVYFVPDMARAVAWYRKVLDLPPNHDTEYYAGFTVGGHELGLHPGKPSADGQLAHWSVDDLDAVIAHFVSSGAEISRPVQDVGGGIRVAAVRDPFGNDIGLIQNPHSPNR